MAISVKDFQANIAGGGWSGFARNNLFKVEFGIPGPVGSTGDDRRTLEFICRAAQVPSYTQGNVDVPYRGRILKIAGDRTYEPWTVTIMNDAQYTARSIFEKWSNLIQDQTQNYSLKGDTSLFGTLRCSLLNRKKTTDEDDYKTIRVYTLYGVWPSSVSAIDLDWGNNDAIQEFTVEFQVQYITSGKDKATADAAEGDGAESEDDPENTKAFATTSTPTD